MVTANELAENRKYVLKTKRQNLEKNIESMVNNCQSVFERIDEELITASKKGLDRCKIFIYNDDSNILIRQCKKYDIDYDDLIKEYYVKKGFSIKELSHLCREYEISW